jgi:hypothetical protein
MSQSRSPNKHRSFRSPNSHLPPPLESRYCLICDNITRWKYNRAIGHGCCTECGSSSLYSGKNKEDVLQKLELHKNGFNFLSLKED